MCVSTWQKIWSGNTCDRRRLCRRPSGDCGHRRSIAADRRSHCPQSQAATRTATTAMILSCVDGRIAARTDEPMQWPAYEPSRSAVSSCVSTGSTGDLHGLVCIGRQCRHTLRDRTSDALSTAFALSLATFCRHAGRSATDPLDTDRQRCRRRSRVGVPIRLNTEPHAAPFHHHAVHRRVKGGATKLDVTGRLVFPVTLVDTKQGFALFAGCNFHSKSSVGFGICLSTFGIRPALAPQSGGVAARQKHALACRPCAICGVDRLSTPDRCLDKHDGDEHRDYCRQHDVDRRDDNSG